MTLIKLDEFLMRTLFESIERRRLMASIDAELHGLAVYLADAAVDVSLLGPRDEFFLTELESKANAIVSEVEGIVSRIRSLLPGVPDEIHNYEQVRSAIGHLR